MDVPVIIAGGIGALIGAAIKFLFDNVFGPRLESSREAKAAIRRHSDPLLQAAIDLDTRLENLIRHADATWFTNEEDDYYRLSTLYLFGRYFAVCKRLEDDSFIVNEESDAKAKAFGRQFNRVFKGVTGFFYFKDWLKEGTLSTQEVERATVPRLVLTAIGEVMMNSPTENGRRSEVIGLTEFAEKYESPEFKRWFSHPRRIFSGFSRSKSDPQWNRILVMASDLRAFIHFLDPKRRYTQRKSIWYAREMHPSVAPKVRQELAEARSSSRMRRIRNRLVVWLKYPLRIVRRRYHIIRLKFRPPMRS